MRFYGKQFSTVDVKSTVQNSHPWGYIYTREQTLKRGSSAESELKRKGGRPLRTAKKEESGARVRSLEPSFLRSFAAMQIFVKTCEFLNRGSLKSDFPSESGVCFWILVIHCCWSCVFVSALSLLSPWLFLLALLLPCVFYFVSYGFVAAIFEVSIWFFRSLYAIRSMWPNKQLLLPWN